MRSLLFAGLALVVAAQARPDVQVRLTQAGFLPGAAKRATVVSDAAQGLTWELRDARARIVASGRTTVFGADADSGDRVHVADFSTFAREGRGFTLRVGRGVSHPFDITRSVFHRLKYDALAYFYQTRSGIPIEMPYAGGAAWVRPAGHIGVSPNQGDTRVPCAPEAGCSYTLDVSGGWYDAGDHGKYVVNGGIAVWTLLNEYERALHRQAPGLKAGPTDRRNLVGPTFRSGDVRVPTTLGAGRQAPGLKAGPTDRRNVVGPTFRSGDPRIPPTSRSGRQAPGLKAGPTDGRNLVGPTFRSGDPRVRDFADGTMSIPERNNGVPDLLDEARWELEFLMKMQVPGGQPHAGMAHHKIHDVKWTPIPTRPEGDPEKRQLRPVSTAATLNLAAVTAQCARLWTTIDPAFSAKCLGAAETAWEAARANPVIIAPPGDSTGGGSYSDRDITDEQYWAASELFIATGKDPYRQFVTSSDHYRSVPAGPTSMTWNSTAALGSISLATAPNGLPAEDVAAIRRNIVAAADGYAKAAAAQGYGVPVAGRYQWGSNSVVLNNALVLALAFDYTHEVRYLDAVTGAMDYVLGRNPMDKSYVSGYGERQLANPHHRFWAKQADPALPGPPPGVLAGGPNSGLQDPRSRALAGCAPQKCYEDHYQAYSLNEVCLNWNAPLAWVSAWLDEHASSGRRQK